MASESEPPVPLDEATALQELERLRRAIEESRRRRNDVQAEFDRFVRGFRTSALEAATAELPAIPPGSESPIVKAPAAVIDAPIIVARPAGPVTPATTTDRDSDEPVTPVATSVPEPADSPVAQPPTVKSQFKINGTVGPRLLAPAGVLVVLAAVGALLTRKWHSPPERSSRSIPTIPAVRQNPQPATARDRQPAAPPEPSPPRSEILAVRRVWVRVVVDGVKTTERELEAGERVALPPGRTAAIRAGNAGAVQVTINGEDRGSLGAEGEVADAHTPSTRDAAADRAATTARASGSPVHLTLRAVRLHAASRPPTPSSKSATPNRGRGLRRSTRERTGSRGRRR